MIYVLSKIKKRYHTFLSENYLFRAVKYCSLLHRLVFVMTQEKVMRLKDILCYQLFIFKLFCWFNVMIVIKHDLLFINICMVPQI